jgi:hypothetical protein
MLYKHTVDHTDAFAANTNTVCDSIAGGVCITQLFRCLLLIVFLSLTNTHTHTHKHTHTLSLSFLCGGLFFHCWSTHTTQ